MRRAFIVGGTGLIGTTVALHLSAAGWRVDVIGRRPSRAHPVLAANGISFLAADRRDHDGLRRAFGDGADLVIDCACYTADDAAVLAELSHAASATVMLSSKAVYVDAAGRHINSDSAPEFDGPIRESQATVAPGDADYTTAEGYGANKRAAELVVFENGNAVTVVRASKVHGPHSSRPREWYFVKRVLDRRRAVFLSHAGSCVDHTTAVRNIAALIDAAARTPGTRVLNCADPDAPSSSDIARTIAAYLNHEWTEVLLGDDVDPALGRTPWDAPHPVILDTTAATELGYVPAGSYAQTVGEALDWLAARAAKAADGSWMLPNTDDPYFSAMFDYAAEDAYLAANP
jgi:nucleoside-diphosphate-sugar epimerase